MLTVSRVFRIELSPGMVRDLGERASAVDGMNRKLRVLQSELVRSGNNKISNCTHNPRAWEINQILGFEQIKGPKLEFNIIWMSLPPYDAVQIHLVERDPEVHLPEGESGSLFGHDLKFLRRGHHVGFSVANFNSFVQTLKEKGIKTHESSQPGSRAKQVFFFDPDSNGLEVASRPFPPN